MEECWVCILRPLWFICLDGQIQMTSNRQKKLTGFQTQKVDYYDKWTKEHHLSLHCTFRTVLRGFFSKVWEVVLA